MSFEVAVADSASLLASLRERRIDLAITRTAASAAEADLQAEPLFHEPLVVMAGRRHRLMRRKRLTSQSSVGKPGRSRRRRCSWAAS
jgi:DNA-binding transcriptional LysR family regulator